LGAEEVLHSDELDFSELVLALTEDRGADVVLDTVGSALFESAWRSLAQFGRLVLLGEVAGRSVQLNLAEAIFRDAQVLGSSGVSRREVARIAEMVSLGSVTPILADTLPLQKAGVAFDLLVRKQVLGRLALTAR
jgi:NADPH:quinone reductase-like Zn-dependent oxidoreductase